MFAHEASYDCVFCGIHECYGECRSDGENIIYGGDHRDLEILPALQATSGPPGGFRGRQVTDGRPTCALPEVSQGLPATTKPYSRNLLSGRNRFSDAEFNSVRAMDNF